MRKPSVSLIHVIFYLKNKLEETLYAFGYYRYRVLKNKGFLNFISLSQMLYKIPHNIIVPSWMAKEVFTILQ